MEQSRFHRIISSRKANYRERSCNNEDLTYEVSYPTVNIQQVTKVTNIVETSVISTETDEYQEMIPSSIYPDTDVRCKKYPCHINPVIESELVKHKITIDDLFKRSIMNMNYKFERNAKKHKISIQQKQLLESGEGTIQNVLQYTNHKQPAKHQNARMAQILSEVPS